MLEPQYQSTPGIAVDFPTGTRPLTAEYFVDWLIEYKGLNKAHRDNVISNLKNDYARVELQGALKQSMTHPPVIVQFSIFGRFKS